MRVVAVKVSLWASRKKALFYKKEVSKSPRNKTEPEVFLDPEIFVCACRQLRFGPCITGPSARKCMPAPTAILANDPTIPRVMLYRGHRLPLQTAYALRAHPIVFATVNIWIVSLVKLRSGYFQLSRIRTTLLVYLGSESTTYPSIKLRLKPE